MPFCTNCGSQVGPNDKFCATCGLRQEPAASTAAGTGFTPPPPRPAADPFSRFSPRTASMLCYIPFAGWIACIVVLASPQFRGDSLVRFNAFQGLYLFVAWLLIHNVVYPLISESNVGHVVSAMMRLAVVGAWIFMLIKASHNEKYSLPILGELAERSLAEQL